MTSKIQETTLYDRVQGLTDIDLQNFLCCICFDILWQPVVCGSCQNAFCSKCVNDWLSKPRKMCPMRCEIFIPSKCPESLTERLDHLQMTCLNYSNCRKIVDFKDFEKHQEECDFTPKQCPKCDGNVSQKYLAQHVIKCTKVRKEPAETSKEVIRTSVVKRCGVCRNGQPGRTFCIRGGRSGFNYINSELPSSQYWYFDSNGNLNVRCICSCHN